MLSRGVYLEEIIKWNLWELFFRIRFCVLRIIYKWFTWRQNIATWNPELPFCFKILQTGLSLFNLSVQFLQFLAPSLTTQTNLMPNESLLDKNTTILVSWSHRTTSDRRAISHISAQTSVHKHYRERKRQFEWL